MLDTYSLGILLPKKLSDYQDKVLADTITEHKAGCRALTLRIPGWNRKPDAGLDPDLLTMLRKRVKDVQVVTVGDGNVDAEIWEALRGCDEIYGFLSRGRSRCRPDRVWFAYNSATAVRAGWMKLVYPWLSSSRSCHINHR